MSGYCSREKFDPERDLISEEDPEEIEAEEQEDELLSAGNNGNGHNGAAVALLPEDGDPANHLGNLLLEQFNELFRKEQLKCIDTNPDLDLIANDALEQFFKEHGISLLNLTPTQKNRFNLAVKRYLGKNAFYASLGSWKSLQKSRRQTPEELSPEQAEQIADAFDLSDDGICLAFEERFKDRLCFDHNRGRWYKWTGKNWQLDDTKLAFAWTRELCRNLAVNVEKPMPFKSVRKARGVEDFAESAECFAVTSATWNTKPMLLGTPGGVVDLTTGRLENARPSDFITKLTSATPAARKDGESWETLCPKWIKFLKESTRDDPELQRFMQVFCGYCLTGDISEHAIVFICGPGGNGKSVFINTIRRILGEYAKTAPMETFLSGSGDRHPTEIAMLQGARAILSCETEEGRFWAETRIKQLTGGDEVTARFMRQDFFSFVPQFKLMIIGNHKPRIKNVDDAIRRRFHLIAFENKPAVINPHLEEELIQEHGAILGWMIEGCLTWQKERLRAPASVKKATEEYFLSQDIIGQWIEDCCLLNPNFSSGRSDLFANWKKYAEENGAYTGNSRDFAIQMARRGIEPAYGHGGKKIYRGIGIKEETVDDSRYR